MSTQCFQEEIFMKTLASYLTRTFHRWEVPLAAIVALIGLAIDCSIAMAQSGAGSIQGTVTDPTEAVIPGATIRVVNQATGVTVRAFLQQVYTILALDFAAHKKWRRPIRMIFDASC